VIQVEFEYGQVMLELMTDGMHSNCEGSRRVDVIPWPFPLFLSFFLIAARSAVSPSEFRVAQFEAKLHVYTSKAFKIFFCEANFDGVFLLVI
jgi:hypothetical protein